MIDRKRLLEAVGGLDYLQPIKIYDSSTGDFIDFQAKIEPGLAPEQIASSIDRQVTIHFNPGEYNERYYEDHPFNLSRLWEKNGTYVAVGVGDCNQIVIIWGPEFDETATFLMAPLPPPEPVTPDELPSSGDLPSDADFEDEPDDSGPRVTLPHLERIGFRRLR